MYMQRTTSGAARNDLYTTIKYMRGASGIGMGTTIIHLRCTTSGAANNGMSTTINPPCSAASFVVNLEPTPGHVPRSVCVWGPSLLTVFIYLFFHLRFVVHGAFGINGSAMRRGSILKLLLLTCLRWAING